MFTGSPTKSRKVQCVDHCQQGITTVGIGSAANAKGDLMEQLFSIEEAARRLGGISKWTVHAWLSQGRLQRTKVGGRTMIRESELAKVIEDGGKSPAPRSTQQANRMKTKEVGERLDTGRKKLRHDERH
jgi:excisionase family DNA binding protein